MVIINSIIHIEGSPYLPSIIYKGDDMMNKEIWKDIKGFEKRYQISNLGRVKSLSKFVNNNPNYSSIGYYTKEKILKEFDNKRGYKLVKLYKDNKKYTKKIHRLVAEAFISNPENKLQVNHIDGNKQNNCVSNLEWNTCKENINHAFKNNLINMKKGKENPHSKKINQYDLNDNYIKTWFSITEAQKFFHIRNISKVCHNKRKTAGGYKWRFVND